MGAIQLSLKQQAEDCTKNKWEKGYVVMKKKVQVFKSNSANNFSRRNFISSSTAALSSMIVAPSIVRGAEANSKITIGLIGCGGRGSWITDLVKKHGGFEVTALADYFQKKVDKAGEKFGVDPSRRFTGLNGYKKMLELDLDAVLVQSPPCFHPEQIAAAVDAGKHVYTAKPVSVDVPGCRTVAESVKKATKNKQAVLVDFQHRADDLYQETVRRLHDGALGELTFGEVFNHSGGYGHAKATPGTPEARLRNWLCYKALSGDYMVEINVHTIDMMNWMLKKPPLYAVGSGGCKAKKEAGDNWDHFGVLFKYPGDMPVVFTSKRYDDTAGHDKHQIVEIFGTEGRLKTEYGGKLMILGKNYYAGGKNPTLYKSGAENNIAKFHKMITTGDFSNSTVEPSIQSNMIAIMAREACYKGGIITWEEINKCEKRMDMQLEGLKG